MSKNRRLKLIILSVILCVTINFGIEPNKVYSKTINCQSKDDKTVIYDFFISTEYHEVIPYILGLSAVETGWWRSQRHKDFKNLFSMKDFKHPLCEKKAIYCLAQYESRVESCEALYQYLKKRQYPIDAEGFLKKLETSGYAQDKRHVFKVRGAKERIENARKRKRLQYNEKSSNSMKENVR